MPEAAADPVAPATCTQAEFARLQGWERSYVTKLKHEGRLVFTADGKLVDVAASLERIKATTVADSRADQAVMGPAFNDAKDRNEHYTAELQRIRFEKEIGQLLDRDDVASVVSDAVATLCAWLDSLPDRLAPQIAALGSEEGRIKALLVDHINEGRTELARGFKGLLQRAQQPGKGTT